MNTKKSGMSLIEVLVGLGIAAVMMAAVSTMFINQSRATRGLAEKLAALDLEKLIIQTLADGQVCNKMLTDTTYFAGNPATFNPALIATATPPTIALPNNQILANINSTITGPNLVSVGQTMSAFSPNLVVSDIRIGNITPTGPDAYRADFIVEFDNALLTQAIRPITVSTLLATDPLTPGRIVSCGAPVAPPGPTLAGYWLCSCTSWYWRGTVVSPANVSGQLCYRPNGCSGGCHSGAHVWSCTAI